MIQPPRRRRERRNLITVLKITQSIKEHERQTHREKFGDEFTIDASDASGVRVQIERERERKRAERAIYKAVTSRARNSRVL